MSRSDARRRRTGSRLCLWAVAATIVAGADRAEAGTDLRVICQPCSSHEECGDGGDFCLDYGSLSGGAGLFCGMQCATDADCATLPCLPTDGGPGQCGDVTGLCRAGPPFECALDEHCPEGHACEAGRCVTSGPVLGLSCSDGSDCGEGLECVTTMAGDICTQACDWLVPTSCPVGFFCTERDRCGDGICVPGEAGEGADGTSCSMDTDCQGLFCSTPPSTSSPVCGAPCEPASPRCPEGSYCAERGVGCGSCVAACEPGTCPAGQTCIAGRCVAPGADGSPCTVPDECRSGICEAGTCGAATVVDGGAHDGGRPGSVGETELYEGACACAAPGSGGRGAAFGVALAAAAGLALARRPR